MCLWNIAMVNEIQSVNKKKIERLTWHFMDCFPLQLHHRVRSLCHWTNWAHHALSLSLTRRSIHESRARPTSVAKIIAVVPHMSEWLMSPSC